MRIRVWAIGNGPGPRNVGLENDYGERTVVTYRSYLQHYKHQVREDRDWWLQQANRPEGVRMTPGFFDNYTDLGGGGKYLSSDEKLQLIENGITFSIKALTYDADNQYGPRYVAFIDVPAVETGEIEERKIGFPVGSGAESRDAMLKAMDEYLKGDEAEPVKVKLEKPARAINIVPAE